VKQVGSSKKQKVVGWGAGGLVLRRKEKGLKKKKKERNRSMSIRDRQIREINLSRKGGEDKERR